MDSLKIRHQFDDLNSVIKQAWHHLVFITIKTDKTRLNILLALSTLKKADPRSALKAALHRRTERSWQPPESIRLNQQDMQNIQRVGNNTETMLSRRIKKELETIAKSGSREHEKEKDKTWERWAQPFNRFTVNCKDTIHDVT